MLNKKHFYLIFLLVVLFNCPKSFGQCNREFAGTYSSGVVIVADSSNTNSAFSSSFPSFGASFTNIDCSNHTFNFSNCIGCVGCNIGTGTFNCDFTSINITYYFYYNNDLPRTGPYYQTLVRQSQQSIYFKTTPACSGCNGTALAILSGYFGQNYSYSWSNGQTTNQITGLCPGTYICTVTDECSEKTAAYATIDTSRQPAVSLNVVEVMNISCYGDNNGSAKAEILSGTPPYNYQWFPNNVNDSIINNLSAGDYSLITTDANGCANFSTVQITQPEQLELNITSSSSINLGETKELIANVNGGTEPYIYSWNGNKEGSSYSVTPSNTTQYNLIVTDKNGCIAIANTTVDVSQIFVPTAFSPNGDGNNDWLYVRGQSIKDMSFNVYDRWGNLVYTTTNINYGWDGNLNGHPAGTGTYNYYLTATLLDGTNVERTGTVLLVH